MENLAHTLVGLAIAKAGLERATPLATSALVISSNLPDLDVVAGIAGTTGSYLEYHRGFTHSFVGLAVLATVLTLVLTWIHRRFRMRRDPFRRPLRPGRIFALSYLGGLTHLFLDFTNAYGVRPLMPFNNDWFYGDLIFVVDPWIWLILGSSVIWIMTSDSSREAFAPRLFIWLKMIFWLLVGALTSLAVALAARNPSDAQAAIPAVVRVAWFIGLSILIAGIALGWGRAGARLARGSLVLLLVYYGGMFLAHQSAVERAENSLPAEAVTRLAAWPMPANPLLWQSVAANESSAFRRYVNIGEDNPQWSDFRLIDPKFITALRGDIEARRFLDFARFASANVEERESGYTIVMQDLRFSLRMRAELDGDLNVISVNVRW